MTAQPDFEAYRAALVAHADHPVRVEMTVLQLTMLLSTLQLALRHPRFPAGTRPYVEDFLEGAIANLTRLAPVLGATMRAGNDPAFDVTDMEATP